MDVDEQKPLLSKEQARSPTGGRGTLSQDANLHPGKAAAADVVVELHVKELHVSAPSPPRTLLLQASSAFLYGATAVSMNFVNKYTMQIFPLTNVVVALQMAFTFAILHGLLQMGLIDFPSFSWNKVKQLSGVTILYTANTVFSLVGLKTLNIPMYNVLKRMTPVLILVLKGLYRKKWPQLDVSMSVVTLVAGCVIAGIGDLAFDFWGYVYALLSCTCQALYLLIVEFQGSDFNVSSSEMLYYNAITSLPLLILITFVTGEAQSLPDMTAQGVVRAGEVGLSMTLISCSLMGMLLNYSQFLCTTTNSALTTTIVGVAKGVLAVLLGFFFLGGAPFSKVNIAGITLNTVGVIWYTIIKFKARAKEDEARQEESQAHGHKGTI